jgi:outer membrane receptor protein involved in Fe transport
MKLLRPSLLVQPILIALFFISNLVIAGTTGKIAGTVTDADTKEPLIGANVVLEGTQLGAATDIEGNYVILNVPPGVYSVVVSMVGYQKTRMTEVRVAVDFTTRLDVKIKQGSIDLPPVVVQGERNPLIRQDLTNPQVAITSDKIQELPVNSLAEVIKLQAGVVVGNDGEIHIRGGRANEIAYTINGVPINNPFNNSQSVGIATNAVEEVSVSSGTFSAEYGNALSGVINYVTREATEKYTGSIRAYAGDLVSSHKDLFFNIEKIDPLNVARIEGTLGGPVPLTDNNFLFFLSTVYANNKGNFYGIRLYRPTDSFMIPNEFPTGDPRQGTSNDPYYFNPMGNSGGRPTGDSAIVPMNWGRSLNFTGKLSYRISPTFKLTYDLVLDHGKSQGYSRAYKYNPDGRPTYYSDGVSHTFGITHTVSEKMFYVLKGSLNSTDDRSYTFEDPYDPGYVPDNWSRVITQTDFLAGGTDLDRDYQKSRTIIGKFDAVAQLFKDHEVKFGGILKLHKLDREFYTLLYDTTAAYHASPTIPTPDIEPDNVSYVNYTREPVELALYLQDKIELAKSLILNIGLRYEYLSPKAKYNTNLDSELTNATGLYANNLLADATPKHSFSPRISVSYPITDRGVIRFSYGHFYQNPTLISIFQNPNFIAPGSYSPTFGNPNLKPEHSIQYEMGLQQQLTDNLKVDITGFYKDVTDLLEYETFRASKGDKTYSVISNINYANVKGITVSLYKRRSPGDLFSMTLDYTFQVAVGNRTDEDAFFFDQRSGKQTEKLYVSLPFERSHVLNGTLSLNQPDNWAASVIWNVQTGTPYTPAVPLDARVANYVQNSASRPISWNVDMKLEKFFMLGSFTYSVFLQVQNLFDIENEVYVWSNSGQSLYNADEKRTASNFDGLRERIGRGDAGLIPISEIDNYYARAEWLSRPREIRAGISVMF